MTGLVTGAVRKRNLPLIKLALRAGFVPATQLCGVIEGNDFELAEMFLGSAVDVTGEPYLNYSVASPERNAISELLLKHNADPLLTDKYDRNALVMALNASNNDMARRLVAHGVDVNSS